MGDSWELPRLMHSSGMAGERGVDEAFGVPRALPEAVGSQAGSRDGNPQEGTRHQGQESSE